MRAADTSPVDGREGRAELDQEKAGGGCSITAAKRSLSTERVAHGLARIYGRGVTECLC